MKLSYIGTRATKDSTDKKRYAEAKWKDGDMKAEDIGYIFRCLLKDYGYGFTTYMVNTLRTICCQNRNIIFLEKIEEHISSNTCIVIIITK